MRSDLLDQLKRAFRPEFLNRVDNVVVFHALTREHIGQIVSLELDKVRQRLAEYAVALEATDEAKQLIADEGYSEEYGARPLRRVIQQRVEDPLSDGLLSHTFELGDTMVIDAEDGAIVLRAAERKPKMEPETA